MTDDRLYHEEVGPVVVPNKTETDYAAARMRSSASSGETKLEKGKVRGA